MLIEGPFTLAIMDNADGSRVLTLTFTSEFQALTVAEQGEELLDYLRRLDSAIAESEDDNPDRVGMHTARQIVEQLVSYVESGEIDLEEPIQVEIAPSAPGGMRLN